MRALIAAALLLVSVPAGAFGQQQMPPGCAPYKDMVAGLAANYGEHPIAVGDVGAGLLEVFASNDQKTWTIIVRITADVACEVISGNNWTPMSPPYELKGRPS